MVREFVVAEVVDRPLPKVFAFVADHRNVRPLLAGVRRWDPVTPGAAHAGARYEVEIEVMGLRWVDLLRITVWRPGQAIEFVNERAPIRVEGRWRFRATAEGTRVELRIRYEPPGRALGALLALPIERAAQMQLQAAMRDLKEVLEEG